MTIQTAYDAQDPNIPFVKGTFTQDADITFHVKASHGIDSIDTSTAYWGRHRAEEASIAVEKMLEMIPQVEGQNKVSPLVKREFESMVQDVFAHAYRMGQVDGLETGYWICDELYGCPLGEDASEDNIKTIQAANRDMLFGGGDIEDGWVECAWLLSKIDSADVVEFSQKHWMSWKEGTTWLNECRAIASSHLHTSKENTVHEPKEVFEYILKLAQIYVLDDAVAIQFFHDALDVFEKNNMFRHGDVEEYKVQVSLDRLEAMRAGVSLEDIFA